MTFQILDLFSGIGGFSLGLEAASPRFHTAAFCEIDPYNRAILNHHWPGVPQHDDVRTIIPPAGINAICGGFPCQDASSGNAKGQGTNGPRTGLFREIIRLANKIRPHFILMENVSNLLGRGFGDVLGAVAEIGYDAEWECISAFDAGAEHERDRVWILCYPSSEGRQGFGEKRGRILSLAKKALHQHGNQAAGRRMEVVSSVERIRNSDGISLRMEQRRLYALGNSIVPAIVEEIGRQILDAWNTD